MPLDLPLADSAAHLAAALLTGGLIGAQREATPGDHPGLRDFLLISLAGGACGLLDNSVLSAAVLLSLAVMMVLFHWEERAKRTGITTELAGVATFLLALLASSPEIHLGKPIAIGTAILIAAFLEARQRLHHLLRETITEPEFNATLAFITLVLVIYPLLPEGAYGPYQFFSPRQVWMFVILISAISYIGYFFEKFLGEERGMVYTSLLGGLASTSAVTLHLAQLSKQRPQAIHELMSGFLIANTVQFPRTFLIIVLVNRDLALACAWPLAAMMLTGIAAAWIASVLSRRAPTLQAEPTEHRNPLRLQPALRFGVLFTLVVFLSKWAASRPGSEAFLGTSFLGGFVDVATVIAPASDLLRAQSIGVRTAEIAVLLALGANAVLKIAFAASSGTRSFTLRIALSFVIWTAAAGAGVWLGTL